MEGRIALVGLALILAGVFVWRMKKERYEVRNRGVNESAIVSLLRSLAYIISRTISYSVTLYLLASVYFYIAFRADCRDDPLTRQTYERAPLVEHVAAALVWPLHQDAPPCG